MVVSTAPFVVTGGASGIGSALAQRLRAANHEVLVLDLVRDSTLRNLVPIDLRDATAIAQVVDALPPRIAGLANVAGLPGTRPVADIMAVNFLALRELSLLLAARIVKGGAIVCVSSITAHRCTWSDAALDAAIGSNWHALLGDDDVRALDGRQAYELSKRLVNTWVPLASAKFAELGVRVCSVSPGPVHTPILVDFETSIGKDHMHAVAELVGRHARPGEIAAVIEFLLGRDAAWVNGVDIRADGGLAAMRRAAGRCIR
jgi:NAD(P)-dependent dehydrogenase (short-subunit alcohol dehydrogenase family)